MIPKPGKNISELESYRPVSLLPIVSKLFEKLVLKRLKPMTAVKHLVATHKFGIRRNDSKIDQVHRSLTSLKKHPETKTCALLSFLTLHKVSTEYGIDAYFINLGQFFPIISINYFNLNFLVKHEVLYLLYINDVRTTSHNTKAKFADDTAVMAIGETVESSTKKTANSCEPSRYLDKNWQIKPNESKSVHIDFTDKKIRQQRIFINGTHVPYANIAKYLSMILDAKLRWKDHIKKKRDEFNIKVRKMYWLLERNSELSIHNKIILYNQVMSAIQRYQNKVLKYTINAPWYVRNSDHRDLRMETVTDIIATFANFREKRLQNHITIGASRFLNLNNITRRLEKKNPFELVRR
jgi:hypothetical protein